MALWIGGQIKDNNGLNLFYSNSKILSEKGAKIYMETKVTNVNFENKVVYAEGLDGKEI